MTAVARQFVSNRLQPAMLALLCLMAAQLIGALATSCTPEPLPMGAIRVDLSH